MQIYTPPIDWDAKKFATRYGLNPFTNDFYVNNDGELVVTVVLPDDPPIFDPPDPFVLVPSNTHVHHWPTLKGWIGEHTKVEMGENTPNHHECYYVVAENMAALEALRLMPQTGFENGQPAYLKDTHSFVIWDGSQWVGFPTLPPIAAMPTINVPNTVLADSTNGRGRILVGTVGTADIVLTFSVPFVITPAVGISYNSNLCQVSVAATTTSLTFKSNNNQINGKTLSYVCL